MAFSCLFGLFLFAPQCEPWGQDSDLAETPTACENRVLAEESTILFYRRFMAPAGGPRCSFHPTCSHYMLDALQKHGSLKGFLLGCDRMQRENSAQGLYALYKTPEGDLVNYDPVP